jgi:hypothetical protein
MKITRVVTASVISAGIAVGMASPAWADDTAPPPQPAETYTFNWVGGKEPTTWTVTQCGTDCTHIADSGNSINGPFEADAYALNGYWTMFVHRTDMIACDNGDTFPADAQYNWNSSLQGMATANTGGQCGDPSTPVQGSFTLTKVG